MLKTASKISDDEDWEDGDWEENFRSNKASSSVLLHFIKPTYMQHEEQKKM